MSLSAKLPISNHYAVSLIGSIVGAPLGDAKPSKVSDYATFQTLNSVKEAVHFKCY